MTRTSSLAGHTPLLLVLAVFVAIRALYLDSIPLFSSAEYFNTVLTGVDWWNNAGYSLPHFEYGNHISFLYLTLIGIPQLFFNASPLAFNLTLTVVGVLTIVLFYKWLCVLREKGLLNCSQQELGLFLALFSFSPIVMASSFYMTSDQGLLLFTLWLVYALVAEKKWQTVLAGIALVFTKETGVGIYLVGSFLYFLFVCFRPLGTRKERLECLRRYTYLLNPLLALGVYAFFKVGLLGRPLIVNQSLNFSFWRYYGLFDLWDRAFHSYFVQLFLLNFHWVLFPFALVYLVKKLWQWVFLKKSDRNHERGEWVFCA